MTLCAKPGCQAAGVAVLAYDYAARLALLDDPAEGEISPHLYVMCQRCASKITPPMGWTLEDRRVKPPLFLERLEERRAAELQDHERSDDEAGRSSRQLFFGSSA
ncbi:MAG: DUF3499 family protein [Actinomycetota bacterium]|nr:DUF3499 family protein [Actinomycetota bacterium]